MRILIILSVLCFIVATWHQSRVLDECQIESPGHPYLWNVNWYDLQPAELEKTHGHRTLPPEYKRVYEPVNVKTADGIGFREEWEWIVVQVQ